MLKLKSSIFIEAGERLFSRDTYIIFTTDKILKLFRKDIALICSLFNFSVFLILSFQFSTCNVQIKNAEMLFILLKQ